MPTPSGYIGAYIADYIAFSVAGSFPGDAGVPGWVLSGASVDLDFANGRYFGGTLASLLSITRASNETDLLPSSASGYVYNTFGSNVLAISPTFGLLIFEARTNQLLNSTAPATQTTASLGTGTYTLWVNGSGSATPSGGTATITGAAAATNGAPNTFTVTVAGTVTVTVGGSLNFFQLEAGAFGTSGIVTAGATATRAADVVSIIGNAKSAALSLPGSLVIKTLGSPNTGATPFIFCWDAVNFGHSIHSNDFSNVNRRDVSDNSGGSITITNANAVTGTSKLGLSWGATTGHTLVADNGTASTDVATVDVKTITPVLGSNMGSNNFFDGTFSRVTLWNTRLADATLKAFTV
jgi:hypothetical protein